LLINHDNSTSDPIGVEVKGVPIGGKVAPVSASIDVDIKGTTRDILASKINKPVLGSNEHHIEAFKLTRCQVILILPLNNLAFLKHFLQIWRKLKSRDKSMII